MRTRKLLYVIISICIIVSFSACVNSQKKSEVILVGTIDNNSFEAILNEEPVSFRISNAPEELEKAKVLEGDLIEITWYTNEQEQNIVVKITK